MMLAVSKAGHDRNHLYYVWEESEGEVLLVNGTTRVLAEPKRKKKIHVQLIKRLPAEVEEILSETPLTDESIRRALLTYNKKDTNAI